MAKVHIATPAINMKLGVQRKCFRAQPDSFNAGVYLQLAQDCMGEDLIDDDEFLDVVAEVAYWLIHGRLMILPDKER